MAITKKELLRITESLKDETEITFSIHDDNSQSPFTRAFGDKICDICIDGNKRATIELSGYFNGDE